MSIGGLHLVNKECVQLTVMSTSQIECVLQGLRMAVSHLSRVTWDDALIVYIYIYIWESVCGQLRKGWNHSLLVH